MNTVVAGDYKGAQVLANDRVVDLYMGIGKNVRIKNDIVQHYEVMDKDTKTGFSYGKAALGAAAFGSIGTLAGVEGKHKSTYRLALYFRDGKQSLLEVDEKTYATIAKELFGAEDYQPQPPKPKKHIPARIGIFLVSLIICLLVAQVFCPVVDGVIQLGIIGTIFVFGVPIAAVIILPKLIFKS